jgi:hypothetical protein
MADRLCLGKIFAAPLLTGFRSAICSDLLQQLPTREEGLYLCPEGTKASTPTSKSEKLNTSKRGYEDRGVSKKEAEARAWATVNKESGGGKKSGSGRGKKKAGKKKSGKK